MVIEGSYVSVEHDKSFVSESNELFYGLIELNYGKVKWRTVNFEQ